MPHPAADMWALCVLAIVLLAAAIADIRSGKIQNVITYPAIAAGLIGHTLTGGVFGESQARIGLTGSLVGLAVGFAPLLVAWLAGGIGGGDAKLMGAVGALAGWRFALAAMFYGFLIAAVMALAVMIKRRIVRRTLVRIGRFLYLMFTPGKGGDPATADSPKIAFGLALCLGSAAALVDVAFRGFAAEKLLLGI